MGECKANDIGERTVCFYGCREATLFWLEGLNRQHGDARCAPLPVFSRRCRVPAAEVSS